MISLLEFAIVVGTLLSIIYMYYKHAHTYWKKLNVPYIEPSFPFGNMADVIFRRKNMGDKIKEIYDRMRKQNCKYVGLYFFSRKAFLPLDPTLIKNILATDFQYFHDRGIYYDEENDPLSAHLFSLAGPKWKNLRTKLTPAYSPGKLKYMFNIICQCGYQMIEILKVKAVEERTIEMKDIFARYTTDVIGTCAFGLECNTMKNPDAEFRSMGRRAFTQTVGDVFKVTIIRSFPRLAKMFGLGIFAPSVTGFFMDVVAETIAYRERNNVTRNDFLQLLIQLKNNGQLDDDADDRSTKPAIGTALTMDEAAAQAFIFFLAGFETTSTTISFALFEMAMNPDIQGKARRDVNNVLERHDGRLTYEAIMEMHYLQTVIFAFVRLGIFALSVTGFFMDVVAETIAYRERNNVTRNDFLQLLIQLKNNGQLDDDAGDGTTKPAIGTALTMDEAAAQAFIFFLAGFETTSTTISFALFEMAMNPDIQGKARRDVNNVLERHDGRLTYEAIMEMHYLETVIFESLRKYPPAPVFLRKCTKAYPVPDSDVVIEKGMSVLIPAYGMHRDPEYFSEPDLFDPERFNAENKQKIWDYTYIPFGDGPRACIGMRFSMIQIKIALSLILRNFDFSLSQRTKLPLVMEKKGIILAPIGGIWLNLEPIQE